jgi:XTP/dITP diphosphohydrolase
VKLLIATRSGHKLEEIREILAGIEGLELVGLVEAGVSPDPAEDDLEPYETFEENAESKARYFFDLTGLPTVADDSGLEVDALEGRPGVHSKRFAPGPFEGPERDRANNRHLLALLAGVGPERRTARYVCALALVDGTAPARLTRGESPGRILVAERGEGGFGYDPLFFVPELGRTFGEVPAHQKHVLSHRGRAFRQLATWLRTAGRPE